MLCISLPFRNKAPTSEHEKDSRIVMICWLYKFGRLGLLHLCLTPLFLSEPWLLYSVSFMTTAYYPHYLLSFFFSFILFFHKVYPYDYSQMHQLQLLEALKRVYRERYIVFPLQKSIESLMYSNIGLTNFKCVSSTEANNLLHIVSSFFPHMEPPQPLAIYLYHHPLREKYIQTDTHPHSPPGQSCIRIIILYGFSFILKFPGHCVFES